MSSRSGISWIEGAKAIASRILTLGVVHRVATESNGRGIVVDGSWMLNFGSCSYLGLESHPQVIEGALSALRDFGVQYSSSRSYVTSRLLIDLERSLSEIFNKYPVVVGSSTSLLHVAAIPVLVQPGDLVIFDGKVHASVQMALNHSRVNGVKVLPAPHNDLGVLRQALQDPDATHESVWYFCDGLYSMDGDCAPHAELVELVKSNEKLRVYIDDAHGLSWTGQNGAGQAFEMLERSLHDRFVLAVSLSKGFGCGGGALVLPNQSEADSVRYLGPSLIFSGPPQQPTLGACIASANLHLSPEITRLQADFMERLKFMRQQLDRFELPIFTEPVGPVFFIPIGDSVSACYLVRNMMNCGYFLNVASYPAVARGRAGVRFTVTTHLELEDIENMVRALADQHRETMARDDMTIEKLRNNFGL